ncbi:hypothetical protein AB0C96_05655 [Streptomyces sp. NPDC048506]|uniref:hypothetical protein n=1 Tax=Streptomyces sp. NPDC048506 TaxID=3155028 RepID=UPI00344757D2
MRSHGRTSGGGVLKHYYRLVYWKRRIGRALGGSGRGPRPGRRRTRQLAYEARPLLVFAVIVAIVVAASALAGVGYDDVGWYQP